MTMGELSTPGDILLDAGTNELEVLVFRLDGGWFGVNVAKVREVVRWMEPTESPHRHASVMGMINMRGTVLPLVDLKGHLDMPGEIAEERDRRIIVTEFNGQQTGFLVDGVEQIHRVSWNKVKPSPDLESLGTRNAGVVSTCTGVLNIGDRMILMLDFESVSDSILVSDKLHITDVPNEHEVDRQSKTVVLAEDSPFMRDLIYNTFVNSGYTGIKVFPDGAAAWKGICDLLEAGTEIDAIVSDIEMPQIDGLHLTKRIREQAQLKTTPVILFSSLISEDNKKKGQQVGATVQIAKPELAAMVQLVDQAVLGQLSEEYEFKTAA